MSARNSTSPSYILYTAAHCIVHNTAEYMKNVSISHTQVPTLYYTRYSTERINEVEKPSLRRDKRKKMYNERN